MNKIHFLRGYWSDCILLESDGKFALIDTGYERDFERILSYLKSAGVQRLEFILITHFHRDHYGSFPLLVKALPVGTVYMKKFSGLNVSDGSGRSADTEFNRAEMAKCESMCLLAGNLSHLVVIDENLKTIDMGDFHLDLFGVSDAIREMYEDADSPYQGQVVFGENTNSVVILASVKGTSIYLGGDAGNEPLAFPKYDRQNDHYAHLINRPIDLMKVPHHGCGNVLSEEMLETYKPRVAVVTNWKTTAERRFTENILKLKAANPKMTILYTDCCGYVFTLGENGALYYQEIERIPRIGIEEVPVAETEAFFAKHLSYLIDDEIISEEEDKQYFAGEEYRGVIRAHMERDHNTHHLVYFVRYGKRIGAASYCTYEEEDGKCFILDFWVFKEYRGLGTGHYCYYALEDYTKKQGAKYYQLNATKQESVRFWRAFGFVEDGVDEWGLPLYVMYPKELK